MAVLLAALLAGTGCRPAAPSAPPHMTWTPVDTLNAALPHSVRVYAGTNGVLPLRAWYVRIDEAAEDVTTRVVVSDDVDRRETASSFASDLGACVVVNGGYFRMDLSPSRHVGLLVQDGWIQEQATRFVTRESIRYPTARAAVGFLPTGEVQIGWVTTRNDTLFTWPQPPPNRPGTPAPDVIPPQVHPWPVRDALGGGPVLLTNSRIRITTDEEVFFGSSIPEVHPRTALGITEDGALIAMVVDGRQLRSRGANLQELAYLMKSVGARNALNLDGGGSSALVVAGVLLNRPQGSSQEREVMSALATYCLDPAPARSDSADIEAGPAPR